MTHLLRLLKHLAVFFLVTLPLEIIGIPLVAMALLFVSRDSTTLPPFLRWFDCNDVNDGINGDPRYRKAWEGRNLWLQRWNWLCFRNPLNFFQYEYLGAKRSDVVRSSIKFTSMNVGDNGEPGYVEAEVEEISGKLRYEYYWVWKYSLFGRPMCIRYRMGWKYGYPLPRPDSNPIAQWVLVLNPFMPYSGK